jgi:SAM-dependent methyltransferase
MLNKLKNSIAPNEVVRHKWIKRVLCNLDQNSKILDAGCGTQPYRRYCQHLEYYAQDFGDYAPDKDSDGLQMDGWEYGELNYTGDIWDIDEKDLFFDVVLCTEVLEHVPYPNEVIQEFSRLVKSGGTLIVTAPYACLPHFQPYFYYSGFSKEWFVRIFEKNNFEILEISSNGNFFSFILQENIRGLKVIDSHLLKFLYSIVLIPKIILDYFLSKIVKDYQLVFGYHIVAKKISK